MSVVKKVVEKTTEPNKKGLKSLYYCRSKSIQRAENVNDANSTDIAANVYKSKEENNNQQDYEECLSCQ